MSEPGLELHEWESRWASVAEVRDDDPAAALSHFADIVRDVLVARGYDVDDAVQTSGADPEIVTMHRSARQAAERAELAEASRAEVEDAIADLGDLFATLTTQRPAG